MKHLLWLLLFYQCQDLYWWATWRSKYLKINWISPTKMFVYLWLFFPVRVRVPVLEWPDSRWPRREYSVRRALAWAWWPVRWLMSSSLLFMSRLNHPHYPTSSQLPPVLPPLSITINHVTYFMFFFYILKRVLTRHFYTIYIRTNTCNSKWSST